jgi:hypothetical protein
MPRYVATLVGLSSILLCGAGLASAQTRDARPQLDSRESGVRVGRIHGVVRDEVGATVAGASVVAMGVAPLPVSARSDASGRFTLALAPGEYILRASRQGYISNYREPIRIQLSTQLERNIVLIHADRQTRLILAGSVFAGDAADPETIDDSLEEPADHPHDEAAWRLRHLPPTALRDVAIARADERTSSSFRPRLSFVDWAMGESARAAASFFTNTDFTGQVNFLTTSSLAAAGGWMPAELPHGVAYIAVGAPVGSAGDWSVRGALSASAIASWVVLGEYTARSEQPHAFRVGVSYSSQPAAAGSELTPMGVSDRMRSVGGMYGFDRWRVRSGLEVDYGMRVDRYDYVSDAGFVSPQLGLRVRVLPRTRAMVSAFERVLAPGANEFLPPAAAGPWLPPERTFSPFVDGAAFRAEHVRDLHVGLEQQLSRSSDGPVVQVQRFRQSTRDQIATLFGLDSERGVGHYYVATPGDVVADGWTVGLSGPLLPRIKGVVEYTNGDARWSSDAEAAAIAALVPSVARLGRERLRDLNASLNATIPETSTKLVMAYRLTERAAMELPGTAGVATGRFDVEVRQALPLHLTRSSRTELVIILRNLSRDAGDSGSLYDELLTVAPPMRIMGGVQVRF